MLEHDTLLSRFLRKTVRNARYTATFNPTSGIEKNWTPILSNKFKRCVGGLIVPEDSRGRVLILPQISKKPEAIVTLLREVLLDISPHLFPHIEGSQWVERDKYLEEEALSLQVENQDVDEVFPGQLVGIKTKYPKEFLRKGTTVCTVMKHE